MGKDYTQGPYAPDYAVMDTPSPMNPDYVPFPFRKPLDAGTYVNNNSNTRRNEPMYYQRKKDYTMYWIIGAIVVIAFLFIYFN